MPNRRALCAVAPRRRSVRRRSRAVHERRGEFATSIDLAVRLDPLIVSENSLSLWERAGGEGVTILRPPKTLSLTLSQRERELSFVFFEPTAKANGYCIES